MNYEIIFICNYRYARTKNQPASECYDRVYSNRRDALPRRYHTQKIHGISGCLFDVVPKSRQERRRREESVVKTSDITKSTSVDTVHTVSIESLPASNPVSLLPSNRTKSKLAALLGVCLELRRTKRLSHSRKNGCVKVTGPCLVQSVSMRMDARGTRRSL